MKIAFSATGPTLNDGVDARFGRCPYFLFIETESGAVEAFPNPAAASSSGAGIQAAQFVVERGARAVVSGNVGPNSFNVLRAAGVPVYIATGMTIAQAMEAFRAGRLVATGTATHSDAHHHHGWPATPPPPPAPGTPPPVPENEVAALKAEIASLRSALADLLEKIDRLTGK